MSVRQYTNPGCLVLKIMPGMNPPATTFTFFHTYGWDDAWVPSADAAAGSKIADRLAANKVERKKN